MKVEILQLIEGAKKAKGLAVVIDVFRAFSTACYILNNGAKCIIPVGDINLAYQLKVENPDYLLIGERGGIIQPGFDYGNSPALIQSVDFSGKTVVHTTSAGTQGLVNARKAEEVITGSFVNAGAIIRYIQQKKPEHLSLVCMGEAGLEPADEDIFCAQYINNELMGKTTDFKVMVEKLKKGNGLRFFKPENQQWSPQADFDLCLQVNSFDFVLQAVKQDNVFCLKRINI